MLFRATPKAPRRRSPGPLAFYGAATYNRHRFPTALQGDYDGPPRVARSALLDRRRRTRGQTAHDRQEGGVAGPESDREGTGTSARHVAIGQSRDRWQRDAKRHD